ncbi:unnamed protein product, partial [Prorocentrum cordatum]
SIRAPTIAPRVVIDDISFQWIGGNLDQLRCFWAAVTRFSEVAKELSIIIQLEKSCYIPSSSKVAVDCKKHGGARGLVCRRWIRNLGQDMWGTKKSRKLTSQRIAGITARRRRLSMLQKAAGKKVSVSTISIKRGPKQDVLSDRGLASSSLALYLVTQRSKDSDPIYMATCDLVCRYAATVWEKRAPLSQLHHAWAAITTKMVGWGKTCEDTNGESAQFVGPSYEAAHWCTRCCGQRRAARFKSMGSLGRFFGCEPVLDPEDDAEEAGNVPLGKLTGFYAYMRDGFELGVCLPCMPPTLPKVQGGLPVHLWGDWTTPKELLENAVFTGGSGLAPSIREIRRCRWAAVQFARQEIPIRAVFGPLPGPLQTVGRSERHAVLMAAKSCGSNLQCVFADLLALEAEANSWGPELESAAAVHAAIWRSLRAQPVRPTVIWIPAHKDVDDYFDKGLSPLLFLGNMRADWFARRGAEVHAAPKVYEECY